LGFVLFFFFLLEKLLVGTIISQLAKIFADIFRYISFPLYRKKIQDSFREFMNSASLESDSEIIIVGHSLGSVIAVDFLSNYYDLFAKKSIILVTAGSPINRLLHCFFPDIYNSSAKTENYLSRVLDKFRWINVYRTLDPIGGKLNSNASGSIINIQINGWRFNDLFGFAHLNYWNDLKVIESVVETIIYQYTIEINDKTPLNSENFENWKATYFNKSVDILIESINIVGKVLLTVVLIGLASFVVWESAQFVFIESITTPKKIEINRKKLDETGKVIKGTVCLFKVNDEFQVSFLPYEKNTRSRTIIKQEAIDLERRGIDFVKLRNNIILKGQKQYQEQTKTLMHVKFECLRLDDVKIRYLAKDPEIYDLPDYLDSIQHPGIIGYLTWRPLAFVFALLFFGRVAFIFLDLFCAAFLSVLFLLQQPVFEITISFGNQH
jgi:hypothetical protein